MSNTCDEHTVTREENTHMDYKHYTINQRDYDITALVTTRTGLLVHEHNTALYYCLSYDTVVAVYDNVTRKLYRTWPDWSSTTAGHVRRFLKELANICSTDYTYYDWKTAADYTDTHYQYDVYAIRSRIPYTPMKMYCGFNAGRYYW